MLTRKGYVLTNFCGDKDLPKSIEVSEILPKTLHVGVSDNIPANYVTAIQER